MSIFYGGIIVACMLYIVTDDGRLIVRGWQRVAALLFRKSVTRIYRIYPAINEGVDE